MNRFLLIAIFILGFSNVAMAQDNPVANPGMQEISYSNDQVLIFDERLIGFEDRIALSNPQINLDNIPSLFFTPSEESLIAEARAGLTTRAPTNYEINQAAKGNVPMGPREVALAGIVYLSSGDWTIWLNGQKVTPKRLPPEILDIKVRKNDIKLKWFDAYTNQIFPIKLKTHQRFNIDTRIFLPG